ncbi:MAG: type II secretion system protein [Thermodesulfobacteriota bacterium]|nr:type II secretion system protein [Thermodesulfobacteriota bacterium]
MKQPFTSAGFTLIELIVSLVVAAIFGTMLITYMHGVFIRGGEPLSAVGNVHQLARNMDQVTAHYHSRMFSTPQTSSGADALDSVAEYLDDNYSQDDAYALRWYATPPFDDGHGGTERTDNDAYLKVTLLSQGGGGRLTSIFWSGN